MKGGYSGMIEYIPYGMLQKQYRWEWVNYYLYQHLHRKNPFPKIQNVMSELLDLQEKQLSSLRQFAASQGIHIPATTLRVEFRNVLGTIKELYDREYQLLQEYMSYTEYFLSESSLHLGIKDLVHSQTLQVNILIELKQTVSQLSKEHTDQKPNYVLEKRCRLERIASQLTFPTVMTFGPQGVIYIVEAGFAYGTEPGKGRVLRLESDGSLTEIAGGFGGPVTGITWHQGYFYVAEGAIGEEHGFGCGQITRFSLDGKRETRNRTWRLRGHTNLLA
jgi:hypothetical protein